MNTSRRGGLNSTALALIPRQSRSTSPWTNVQTLNCRYQISIDCTVLVGALLGQ